MRPAERGRAVPALTSMGLALKFSGVALAVNLAAFALWLLPGVNALVFFVANAYLFSREYFELAAMRYRPIEQARALRRRHRLTIVRRRTADRAVRGDARPQPADALVRDRLDGAASQKADNPGAGAALKLHPTSGEMWF